MNKTFTLILMFLACIEFGCHKKESAGKTVAETITSGKWKVSFYKINTVVHTSDFSNYNFTFNADSTINLTNGSVNITGIWSYANDQNLFSISISTSTTLSEINKNWLLILKNDSEFIFSDDNSSGNEELHFNKI